MAGTRRSPRRSGGDDEPDWSRLERLRAGFLAPSGRGLADYWEAEEDLEAYDQVFAPRIGWKWNAVLHELRDRGIAWDATSVLDFGCGTGVAARTVLPFLASHAPLRVAFHDRSLRAMEFARRRCAVEFPDVRSEARPRLPDDEEIDLVLLSHVLTELTDELAAPLMDLVRRARTVLWVEPGTKAASRRLAACTDELREEFQVLAPCTHDQPCRALVDGEQDWCHFFAAPPTEVFTDPWWVRVGKRLKIDLRALPYCFRALRSKAHPLVTPPRTPPHRLIGRPNVRPKFARFHVCDGEALRVHEVFKGRDPEQYRRLKKGGNAVRWLD